MGLASFIKTIQSHLPRVARRGRLGIESSDSDQSNSSGESVAVSVLSESESFTLIFCVEGISVIGFSGVVLPVERGLLAMRERHQAPSDRGYEWSTSGCLR